jgi:hypothetical protein
MLVYKLFLPLASICKAANIVWSIRMSVHGSKVEQHPEKLDSFQLHFVKITP